MKPNPPLDEVLIECAFHLGKGVGDAKIDQDAFELWTEDYRKSFKKALKDPKNKWERDKKKVLPLAVKLGKVAAALAHPNAIDVDVAQRASDIIKQDPSCPPPAGAGKYCA